MTPERAEERPGGHAVITIYEDGPAVIKGEFEILDADGSRVAAERKIVALCRCGKSQIKPLCDGVHALRNRSEGD